MNAQITKAHNVGVPGLDDYWNPFYSIFNMWPIESPYANDNPLYVHQTHNVNVNPATYTDDITGWVEEYWRSFNVNLYGEYEFKFGLKAKVTGSYNFMNEDFDGMEYFWMHTNMMLLPRHIILRRAGATRTLGGKGINVTCSQGSDNFS